jgi:drug/metabolite transporter (DMT)-like permease
MGPLEFTALFGGLIYWPAYMIFHRRWSRKARLLLYVFLGTIASVGCLGSLFFIFSIHLIWPLQFVFPITTIVSLLMSLVITVLFDDEGNVV